MLWRVYWCDYQIFLAVFIALTYEDIWFLHCAIGYPIAKWSWLCYQVHLFWCTYLVKELGFTNALKATSSCLEKQDSCRPVFHAEARWYILMDLLSSQSLIWFGLSSNQTQSQGPSLMMFNLWCFASLHLHVLGLTNISASFIYQIIPSYWSILVRLLLSPSITFLLPPCLKGIIMNLWQRCWKLLRTIFVSSRSMCSECWK